MKRDIAGGCLGLLTFLVMLGLAWQAAAPYLGQLNEIRPPYPPGFLRSLAFLGVAAILAALLAFRVAVGVREMHRNRNPQARAEHLEAMIREAARQVARADSMRAAAAQPHPWHEAILRWIRRAGTAWGRLRAGRR